MNKNMKVYIAASFAYNDRNKTEERKADIERVVNKIKAHLDAEFYLPHQLKIPNAWEISLEEWSQAVYNHDIQALNESSLIIFISYGKENNAGSVYECGYACAKNIPLIVIKMTEDVESLMISSSAWSIIREKEIDEYDFIHLPHYKTTLDKLS